MSNGPALVRRKWVTGGRACAPEVSGPGAYHQAGSNRLAHRAGCFLSASRRRVRMGPVVMNLKDFAPGPVATDGEAANPGPSAPSKGCRKKASRPKMMPGSSSVPYSLPIPPLDSEAGTALQQQRQAAASPRIHDQKRGVGAWANAQSPQQDLVAAGERLLVHSVSDTTALSSYLPSARKFLE